MVLRMMLMRLRLDGDTSAVSTGPECLRFLACISGRIRHRIMRSHHHCEYRAATAWTNGRAQEGLGDHMRHGHREGSVTSTLDISNIGLIDYRPRQQASQPREQHARYPIICYPQESFHPGHLDWNQRSFIHGAASHWMLMSF